MLLVDDLAAGGTKNLRHTPRGLVTLGKHFTIFVNFNKLSVSKHFCTHTYEVPKNVPNGEHANNMLLHENNTSLY